MRDVNAPPTNIDWRAKVKALLTIYEDVLGYRASPVERR